MGNMQFSNPTYLNTVASETKPSSFWRLIACFSVSDIARFQDNIFSENFPSHWSAADMRDTKLIGIFVFVL